MLRILMFQKFNILIINLHCHASIKTVKVILIISLYKMVQLIQLHKVELASLIKNIGFELTKLPCRMNDMLAFKRAYLQKTLL